MTLSELKDVNINRQHILRKISRCPTVLIYLKNHYESEEILQKF